MGREKITITKRKAKGVLSDMLANMDEDSLARTREKMERITEDYCSYDVAKLLKEKGFDEVCDHYVDNHWDEDGVLLHAPCKTSDLMFGYMCPTHQMAMKWLREVKDFDIVIMPLFRFKGGKIYCYEIHSNDIDVREGQFDTYEQAVDAAIKRSLENLI